MHHSLLPTRFTTALAAAVPIVGALLPLPSRAAPEPVSVVGEMAYQNYIIPKYFGNGATIGLICVSRSLRTPSADFVPKSGQILGRFTSPVTPSPFRFVVPLPVAPTGDLVDLDNDGKPSAGVQVFAAVIATNLFGDSYLEQLEQFSGYRSILSDPKTGAVQQGSLRVYAPDNRQKVPSGPGPDGRLFTDDDPVTRVPRGYSLMRIGPDGRVRLERAAELRMDLLEPVSVESPDFSKMGIRESYDALLSLLEERYAYTQLRRIDWKQVRATYLPRVDAAQKASDMEGYAMVLHDLATGVRDSHVMAVLPYSLKGRYFKDLGERVGGSLGARVIHLTDGRFVVATVGDDTPARKAGLQVGAEIVTIDGKTVAERMETLPLLTSVGTQEMFERATRNFLLSFPVGTTVELGVRPPGETAVRPMRLVATECDFGPIPLFPANVKEPISHQFVEDGNIGYVQWRNFESVAVNIAGWEAFLERQQGRPGMVIDLRGNTGGLMTLLYTMASYLFSQDKPVNVHWLDSYEFDPATKSFVLAPSDVAAHIYSPRPDLTYTGNVVVLVDGGTASSAEFFTQFLQKRGRATVIAEEGTEGAGGSVRMATLPGKIAFTFTGGQMTFAGTREFNIEGKGVTPDIRVPVTLENERRKQKGEDVVLSAAIAYLKERFPKPPAPSEGSVVR